MRRTDILPSGNWARGQQLRRLHMASLIAIIVVGLGLLVTSGVHSTRAQRLQRCLTTFKRWDPATIAGYCRNP